MKRVLIPTGRNATFLHGTPEAASAALAADFIDKGKPAVVILLAESIPRAEEWAEDVAAFLELARPESNPHLHIFDEPPSPEHPDAFERSCDRIAVLSTLGEASRSSNVRGNENTLLVAATPESILAPCPTIEAYGESELTI
ncbi:MAG: hypothetical protein VB997_03785, partial [Opitutales bacterium]